MGGQESKNKTPATSSCILGSDPQSIDTIAKVQPLSLDSLKDITTSLVQHSENIAKVILNCKKDIRNDKELFELVKEYFDGSLKTLEFCNAVEKCLQRTRDNHTLILVAINKFNQEKENAGNNQFRDTLQALRNFKAAANPFTKEFLQKYESVLSQQIEIYKKLESMNKKLAEKLKTIKTCKVVVESIMIVNKIFLSICSIIALANPLGCAIARGCGIVVEIGGQVTLQVLEKIKNALNEKKGVTDTAEWGTFVAIQNLQDIKTHIEPLQTMIESLLKNVDIASEHKEVEVAIEEIKTKLDGFMNNVDGLKSKVATLRNIIRNSRENVLSQIS